MRQFSLVFVQYISLVYGALLIHDPSASKSSIFIFFLNCTIKQTTSLFSDVNQLAITRMDFFLLVQTIEIKPELKFNYIELYPSDKVPHLTKYSFAVINSAPSNDREEHWIVLARLLKTF